MRYFSKTFSGMLAVCIMALPLNGCSGAFTAQVKPSTCTNSSGLTLVSISVGCSTSLPGTPQASPVAISSPSASPVAVGSPSATPVPISTGLQLVGFWQSWSDTTLPLSSVPAAVTTTDIAFSTALATGTLANAQNTYPLASGAAAIHGNGGKVLISFGGATAPGAYANLDPNAFAQDLAGLFAVNPGVYDGVDFDDEQDPRNAQTLINVIQATRAALPHILITYDAFASGADAGTGALAGRSDWQGSDIAVAAAVAQSIDWVNVMDYDLGAWKPSPNMSCTASPGVGDDCYKDVMAEFAKIYPANKIVMGLMVPQDDGGAPMSAANVGAYAQWVRSNGYRGIMLWDINRDTGYSAVNAAAAALGI